MATALTGTPNALVFGPPPVAALTPHPMRGRPVAGHGGAREVPRGVGGALLTCRHPDAIGKGYFHLSSLFLAIIDIDVCAICKGFNGRTVIEIIFLSTDEPSHH